MQVCVTKLIISTFYFRFLNFHGCNVSTASSKDFCIKSPSLVSAFFKNESSSNILELNNIDDFIILIIARLYLQNSCHQQIIKFTLRHRNEEVKEVVIDYPINDQFLLHIEASQSIPHYSADPLIQSFTLYETYNLQVPSLPFFLKSFLFI